MNELKMSNKKTVLIIGGGIGGLYAAWKLSKNGFNIKLMEHQTTLGGLSSSIKKDNCYIDIGPHYVSLDSSSEIFDEITNLLNKENIYKISSIKNSYKSFFQGKILDRSPTLSHLIKKNKFFLFRGLIQNIFFKPITITEKTTTDEYLISLYGKSLYNFWCKPILLQTYGEIPPLSKTKNQFEPITIKKIFNAWWFNGAIWGGIGLFILTYGHPLYSGMCIGVGIKYIIDYLKR